MKPLQQMFYYMISEKGPSPEFGCVVAPSATEAIKIVARALLTKEWREEKPDIEADGATCVYRNGSRERSVQVGAALIDEERSEPDSAQTAVFAGVAYTRTVVSNPVYLVRTRTPLQAMNALLDCGGLTANSDEDVSGKREMPLPLPLSSASWQRAFIPDDLEQPYAMILRPQVLNCPRGFVLDHWHETPL
ncbi:MAG: hypothetical protein IT461_08265 [Planctomycetes bacterium]|nr:hypothetical protein [Planctomycetota bacterium]